MPSDVEAPEAKARPPASGAGKRPLPPFLRAAARKARPVLRPLQPFGAASARLLDYLSVNTRRRGRASTALSIALNLLLFTGLAVFGHFEIWIPATPGDFINVSMVDLPPEPEPPADVIPPEQEPEPEIVEKPKLEAKPVPEPEPKPVEKKAEPEPAPEPEPVIDLTPKPRFAPPAEENEAATVGPPQAPAPAPEEAAPLQPAPTAEETKKPLVENAAPPTPESGLDVAPKPEDEKQADTSAGEEETLKKKKEAETSGDDQFDANPFGPPQRALPAVDLPEGEKSREGGGESGVVAIFCPKQFENKDKAAECAGRTQILSGWRPGASGEDWSKAISLLKADRAAGHGGRDLKNVVGPNAAGQIQDAQRAKGLIDPRRAIDDQAVPSDSNLTAGWGRPDIGPKDAAPSWNLRDDPLVDQKDVEQLKKDLDAANAAKKTPPDDDKKKPEK